MSLVNKIIFESTSFRRMLRLSGASSPFHAYLLTGASLPTLAAFARAFATRLHCGRAGQSMYPCGRCRSCDLSRAGTHPALHVIKPEGNDITIDQIREIIKAVDYKTSRGQYRVFIIEKADSLGEQAANAFLKTLEEPVGKTVFILLTARPEAVITTITSRCMLFNVQLPSPETIIEDYMGSFAIPSGFLYLALLLTDSSLELIHNIAEEQSPVTLDCASVIEPQSMMETFVGRVGTERIINSTDAFCSDFTFPLALFRWLLSLLVNADFQQGHSAVRAALSIEQAGKVLSDTIARHYKTMVKNFTGTYGKKKLAPFLEPDAQRRTIRRLMTAHISMLLNCLQTMLRLALRLKEEKSLPFSLEKHIPDIVRLSELPVLLLPAFRGIVSSYREKLFANVSEKLVLVNLFLELSGIIGLFGTVACIPSPEGGAKLNAQRRRIGI